jgi:soluble lytic murein transglycosylase
MIFRAPGKAFLTIALAFAAAARAAPRSDENFLKAYDAYRAGDPVKLSRLAAQLKGSALEPYLDYWQLRLGLEDAGAPEVRGFFAKYPQSFVAEQLRADWLKELGRRADWPGFDAERIALSGGEDLELRCYALQSRLARHEAAAYEEARAAWKEPRELPASCTAIAEGMLAGGGLGSAQIWERVRALFENGQLTAAKKTLAYLPAAEAPNERLLAQAATAPQKLLARPPRDLDHRGTREMVLFAVARLARGDAGAAAEVLEGELGKRLPAKDLKYAWSRVAYAGARQHLPEALDWYGLAGDAELNDEQLAWKARAALRAGQWQALRDAIDPMSAAGRQDPAWTYWYARALGDLGRAEGAHAYFLRIAGQPSFYGVLAAEELGYTVTVPEPFHAPDEGEVAAAGSNPGLARALELYRLGLRAEATREWMFTIRDMPDAQLLAAAELARRAGVFDRAISTADRTAQVHNFKFRYLAPFREVFREYAQAFDLEESWLLGLVRQESRFIPDAKSSAGARGLMQLMPATARWVARRIGISYSPARVQEVQTNIALGTRYLKYVLDDVGSPVLASAAYNAGPSRARRWRDAKPLEGAVYAETIPFNETRDYVKKVMANTVFYAALLEGKYVPLKQRLGIVQPRVAGERVEEDLP